MCISKIEKIIDLPEDVPVYSDGDIAVYRTGERKYRIECENYTITLNQRDCCIYDSISNSVSGQKVLEE